MPTRSELRAAIDAQRITGDPPGLIGSEKNNGSANVRLGDMMALSPTASLFQS
jgi:hypothetical protein